MIDILYFSSDEFKQLVLKTQIDYKNQQETIKNLTSRLLAAFVSQYQIDSIAITLLNQTLRVQVMPCMEPQDLVPKHNNLAPSLSFAEFGKRIFNTIESVRGMIHQDINIDVKELRIKYFKKQLEENLLLKKEENNTKI